MKQLDVDETNYLKTYLVNKEGFEYTEKDGKAYCQKCGKELQQQTKDERCPNCEAFIC